MISGSAPRRDRRGARRARTRRRALRDARSLRVADRGLAARVLLGSVSRYVGLAAAASSRLDEAARRLEDAAAANEAIGARPLAAHAKADHARVLLTGGRRGIASMPASSCIEALAIHEQLGMAASADKVTTLLGTDAAPVREAARTQPRGVAPRPT